MKKSFFKFIHVFLVISMMVWTFSPAMAALANTENTEVATEAAPLILSAEPEATEQTTLAVEPTAEPEATEPVSVTPTVEPEATEPAPAPVIEPVVETTSTPAVELTKTTSTETETLPKENLINDVVKSVSSFLKLGENFVAPTIELIGLKDTTPPTIDNPIITNNALWGSSYNILNLPNHLSEATNLPVIGGTVQVGADFKDNLLLTNVVALLPGRGFFVKDSSWTGVPEGLHTVTWTTKDSNWQGVSDGNYTFTFNASDGGNGQNQLQNSASKEIQVTVDNTAPTVAFASSTPSEGSLVKGIITVEANFNDVNGLMNTMIGVHAIQWFCNTNWPDNGPYTCIIDTTKLPDGPQKLTIEARDKAGNINQIFRDITIDNTPPSVNFVDPTPGNESYVKGAITGQVTATDTVGMGGYYIRIWKNSFESGINNLVKECSSAPGGNLLGTSQNVTCDIPTLPDGKYVFSAQFLDSSSNWGTAFRTFYVDNTAPIATINGIAPKSLYKGSASIDVHAIDDNYLKTDLYREGDSISFKTYTDVYFGLSWLGDGNYRMVVIDKAGNSTEYTFTIDKIAPTITVKSDYIGNETAKIFSNVSFSLYDSNQVDKYVINSYVSDFSNNKWSDANFQNIKSHLVEGLNTFTLYDLAGNSTTYEFTYDSIAPTAFFTHSNNNDSALVNIDVISTLHASEPIQIPVDWTKVNDTTFTKISTINNKGNMNITDIAGNTQSIFFEVKRIDKTSPVFNISNGDILRTASVEVVATEDNILNFIVDGVLTKFTGLKPDYKVTVTGEGSHTVVANDKAGNSSTVTFIIDTTAPVGGTLTMKTKLFPSGVTATLANNIYIITPALSITGVDVFQSLSVIVNDNNLNTASVPAYIDGVENGNMVYDDVSDVWNYSNQVGMPVFVAGPHTISATFADNAGNSTTLTANFTTDNIAPVGGILTMKTNLFPDGVTNTLANNVYTITPALSLDGADVFNSLSVAVTDDNIDISNVPVYIDENTTANGYMQYDSNTQVWNYTDQTSKPNFGAGTHSLAATFKDLAGNQTTLTANFTTDNTAPIVTNLSHDELAKTITYTFSEPMQLTNNDGTAITDGIANKLAVYQVTGLDYSTISKVTGVTINSATLTDDVLTIQYTGNLIAKVNTKYVVDAWGYKIADLAGNKMVSAENQMFTVIEQTAPTVSILSHDESAKTITYTFSEPMQLVKQDTLDITPLDANLLGIHSVDIEGNYTNTKVDSITSATLIDNVLTVTYSGILPTGKYVVDAWGYNITDLSGNKIVPDASQMFNVEQAPTVNQAMLNSVVMSFGGGSGGSFTYCSNVEYGEWGNAVNGIQERGILSRTPNNCSFTSEQISAASRTMPSPVTQQVLGVKVYSNGTLLKGSNNRIYVVIDNKLQYISSLKELIKYRGPILKVNDEVIASFRYTDGTLIRAKGDNKVYVIKDGKKVHIKSLSELRKYKSSILVISADELANY